VISLKIVRDREGASQGFGFVEVNEEEFDRALELNGRMLQNRRIHVARAKEPSGGI
jgi:RNA recognition motif-containing protein